MPDIVRENKCPYCQEIIAEKATICKHCHSKITPKVSNPFKKYNTFRLGFISGILFCLVIYLLYYLYQLGG